ncbi:MAG: hypothetical protein WC961_07275 [Anaerovoracaceae bacterium]
MKNMRKTFDVHFDNNYDSNSKGFEMTKTEAIQYIKDNNGSRDSYWGDYVGGIVSVVCKETGETVHQEEIF